MSDIDRDNAGTRNTATAYRHKGRGRRSGMQTTVGDTAERITASVRAIERNAQRQAQTIPIIGELERRASDIGEITQTVSRISDQTSLLALNAAIEAARAGDHGRGFAVVADEVRALAETSDKSSQEVKRLAGEIQVDVGGVVVAVKKAAEMSAMEAKAAAVVVETLENRRDDMRRIAKVSEDMLNAALEAERAVSEAQKGAEQVASAAEQQSVGAEEAQSAVQQQAKALDQGQMAARALAVVCRKASQGNRGRIKRRADRRDRRGALGDDPGTDQRRHTDHGGSSTDRSRFATTGVRHPRNIDCAGPNRKQQQDRTEHE